MSPRSRRVAQGIAMVLLVIVLVLVVFGWLNADALGLSDLTPAG